MQSINVCVNGHWSDSWHMQFHSNDFKAQKKETGPDGMPCVKTN